ncbi:flavin reductase family protein [Kribbella sp. VKM Ac-2566]|uniref:flavin reductase family protein n=1 Tax=Kribbella sp. VKM Ac-2566 TaxID=2512218 RepID=UPI001063BCF7|nr:flavin reductase family protein [Kribbella sp. VKM Ac-2566]TDX08296.1 flavin reductase (DIM6/NTAB) family NADH-FMN oxidoreductase RutF [Kribbella sp. VKM Ac-2566]
MTLVIDPKVFYFGTPVVLVSSINEDGSPNLAPMSSAWWLGRSCMLGLDATSKTTENLERGSDCVLNLADSEMVDAVDRLALMTGSRVLPEHKAQKGFEFEPDKFGRAGLTPLASDLVSAPRVAQCRVQLEARVTAIQPFGAPHADARAVEVEIIRTHVDPDLVVPGTVDHIDPVQWDPLIMKFTEFFGSAVNLRPSTLARGFGMMHGAVLSPTDSSASRR